MMPARKDVARALDQLASENLALRVMLAISDPSKATIKGPSVPELCRHADQWTAQPRRVSDAGFARDEM